ncbi:LOW QUALITY PROTEIN: hypothetical protein BC937DRAFT_88916 [Endogone sp. FLAS-F59071]|nr:LOW QUALITY PROTEIN: hypothetical protein BC937DRAFT_88916 [Endogone sp. FLAS-F59071]|eukprot:RUS18329.1 LOW QUALITY PROTEIN: hypothetical protein BC937DRAFT_88916 [Endogone sp. FLAS-F59071]
MDEQENVQNPFLASDIYSSKPRRELKLINDLPDPPSTKNPQKSTAARRRAFGELPSILASAANSRANDFASSTRSTRSTRSSTRSLAVKPEASLTMVTRGKLILKRPPPPLATEISTPPRRLKISHQPLQYIVRNDMYDAAWIDKQENAFTKWINYELEAEAEAEAEAGGEEGFGSMWASPVKVEDRPEPASLDYYSQKLQYERIRSQACILYQSEPFSMVLRKVDDAIAGNRLKIRPDVNMVEDVGVRRGIIDLLFSYDPRWLIVGLETVIGRAIAPLPTTDGSKIVAFMNRYLFHDDSIVSTFRAPSVRSHFVAAMHRAILLRILMTILLLDKAKPARLLPADPCLFRKTAPHKSNRDLVIALAGRILLGEGDIIRHLGYMGYTVDHRQIPLEEYEFRVTNLATDLRDGVRLVRLVEKYSKEWGLSTQLRHPAQARTQQLYNVSLALAVLQRHGLELEAGPRAGNIAAKDVVDGHREKTFALLWKVIMHWKIPAVLDKRALRIEIELLKRDFTRKFAGRKVDVDVDTAYITSDHLTLLLSWCKAVCAFYGVIVRNFTNSFADGRALCYIVHHYHPSVLSADMIKDSSGYLEKAEKEAEASAPPEGQTSWFIPSENLMDPVAEARELDKKNFRLLHAKVKELGGVPLILRHQDFSALGVPDEKVLITYVAYLCARLIHLSTEIRAARCIQLVWRDHYHRRLLADRCRHIISIQAQCRGLLLRRSLLNFIQERLSAAICIQSAYRAHRARLAAAERYAAILWLQAMGRRVLAKRRIAAERKACALQAQCRGYLIKKRYEHLMGVVCPLQAAARRYLARRRFGTCIVAYRAATVIQTAWRGTVWRQRFVLLKLAVLLVEQRRRAALLCRQQYTEYEDLRWAAWVVQQRWRAQREGAAVRARYITLRAAAVVAQTIWRGFQARRDYGGNDCDAEEAAERCGDEMGEGALPGTKMGGAGDTSEMESLYTGRADGAGVYTVEICGCVYTEELAKEAVHRGQGGGCGDTEEAARVGGDEAGERAIPDAKIGGLGDPGEMESPNRCSACGSVVSGPPARSGRGAGSVAWLPGPDAVSAVAQCSDTCATAVARFCAGAESQGGIHGYFEGCSGVAAEVEGERGDARGCRSVSGDTGGDDCDSGRVPRIPSTARGAPDQARVMGCDSHPDRVQGFRGAVRLSVGQSRGSMLTEKAEGSGAGQAGTRSVSRVSRCGTADTGVVACVPDAEGGQARVRGVAVGNRWYSKSHTWGADQAAHAASSRGYHDPVDVPDVCVPTRDLWWAALVVQEQWRARIACIQERQRYLRKVSAAVVIQNMWHASQERRKCRSEFLDIQWATIVIQSHIKRYLARTQYLQIQHAAMTIQRVVRGYQARAALAQQHDEQHSAAIFIQAGVRGFLTRTRIARQIALRRVYLQSWCREAYAHLIAIRIQRAFRNHLAYQAAKRHRDSIVAIQRWWRVKTTRLRFLRLRAAVLFVQARARLVFLRRTRAALVIQKRWQVVVARYRFLRICSATLLIQSVWRAHLVRRTQGAKFRAMRKRIREVNARAEEHMKLSNRTTMALDILLTSKQLSAVLKACYHLDVVTCLSKICCLRLIEHNVIRIIFTLIKQSNRSQPHMEVLKHALNILENVSRTPETLPYVFTDPEGVEILVESLQSYRENEQIFACAASVLVMMARGGQDGIANARHMRQLPNVLKRIKMVHAFAERRHAKEATGSGTAAKSSKTTAKPAPKTGASVRGDTATKKQKEKEKERASKALASLTELVERLEGRS